MKSKIAPNTFLFQVVVQDFKHRQPPPRTVMQSNQVFKRYHDIEDNIPEKTLFRWAKRGKQAMAWARKFGTVLSCHKVDSHMRRLEMIEHLRVEQKPIEVDISLEDFIVGRNLEISPAKKTKKFDVNGH